MESSADTENVIDNSELDYIVSNLKVSKLEQIGTLDWFENVDKISKLYRVAATEALLNNPDEERVKIAFKTHSKLDCAVRELIAICTWKEYVLEKLLKMKPEPKTSFPSYIIVFYEVMIHGIVQSLIYHGDAFNYLEETCDDLVEYCVLRVRQLVNRKKFMVEKREQKATKEPLDEIKCQREHIDFGIGSQCIATLRHVCENLDCLPLSVTTRIYTTHDLPVLVAQLLHQDVWTNKEGGKIYKFVESDWQPVRADDPPLSKMECQIWLLLRELLLNQATKSYHYSDYRKEQLTLLLRHLNDNVIDQLSVLADLQRTLHMLHVRPPGEGDKAVFNPLIVEVNSLYQEQLLNKYRGKWGKLATSCFPLLFQPDELETVALARAFSGSVQFLMDMSENMNSCSYCMKKASKRCSKCKTTWYCSRSCQVQHWKLHQHSCSSKNN
ncbi:zinc finger, MYND-type containing 10 [Nesidiocoris tenuis]|uniref:Zinc finger, MYND-type containing 10 n=1 Tax=Nesidiocoris tenuis TaxID=355587 RepID=A0ABN7B8J4_9HEMI|nr:zinc finger, MYND-type containing 10 [Nesidiocoris tenuis]